MENYQEYKPKAALSRYIECIWILKGQNNETNSIVEPLVPGGRTELIFTKSEIVLAGNYNESGSVSDDLLNNVFLQAIY